MTEAPIKMAHFWLPKLENSYLRLLPYVVIAGVLAAAAWAATTHIISVERENTLSRSAQNVRNLASFFEQTTLQIIRYSDSYLKIARREYVENGGVAAVLRMMEEVPPDHSILSHITIIDNKGTPLMVSGFEIKPGSTAKDRDYFIFHKENAGDQAFISLPHRGRNSGKLLVRFVRRISLPDGSFGGVIFAAIEVRRFTEFFAALDLGPNSSATLVGTDKKIRARSSYGQLGPGQDISGSRLWLELEQNSEGLYKQLSVVDGITRYYAYRKLSEFPLIVAIGVSTEDISQATSRFALPVNTIAILVTIVICIMTFLVCREITIRRRLQENEAQLRSMIDNMPAGIYLKDMKGRYIQTNRQYEKWFLTSKADIRGKTPLDVHSPDIAAAAMQHDQAVRNTGQVIEHEELIKVDGNDRTFLNCKFPIQGASQSVIGTGAVIADITERKETERALRSAIHEAEQANKSKSEFLARMSHDLRTPLNAIIGFSEVMKDERLGPIGKKVYADYANDVFESGHHLLALVNDLLDISRIEAGQYDLSNSDLEICNLVEKTIRLFEPKLSKSQIKISADKSIGLPRLRADQRAVSQMLQNLLSNASKFTLPGGEITIGVEMQSEGLAISVKDTGIGIDSKNLDLVLEPFSQVNDSSAREHGGVGLGLSIVKSLIELHGGHMTLHSQVGVGTTVTLHFPPDRLITKAA